MGRAYCVLFVILVLSVPSYGASKAEIRKNGGKYQLYFNGEPYFIKGAGGYIYYERVKEYGGNSVRIWSTENAKEYLDKAHALGLTVTLGIELGQERRGFNYSDRKAVAEQLKRVEEEVLRYKDHPALLMWGVGNEVDQFARNMDVWPAVNQVAELVHRLDPNHPTTTMLAGVPKSQVSIIAQQCPHIDVLSINAFRDLPYIRHKIEDAGWKGPYLVGEWGASGYWEVDTTEWGAAIEETSTEKADVCLKRYEVIRSSSDKCIGSYVFYWGNKQARTHTILSLFLEGGEENNVVDVLQYVWSGKWPANKAPDINHIELGGHKPKSRLYIECNSMQKVKVRAKDPDSDKLVYRWELYHESKEKKEGGDLEEKPGEIKGVISGEGPEVVLKTPPQKGAYRLYVYVFDGHNNVATANIPFYASSSSANKR
jgi:hypothetical protein